jgi:glutamate synthase domain-containing protein 3
MAVFPSTLDLCVVSTQSLVGGFLYFNPPATSGIKFVLKVNRGHIDLRFAKMETQVSKLKELFEKHIRPDRMKIVKTHKSAAIRTTG